MNNLAPMRNCPGGARYGKSDAGVLGFALFEICSI